VTVLKERLRPLQLLAAAMAVAALAYLATSHTTSARSLWIPAALALSFGFYALFRKVTPVSPTTGTLVETTFLSPLALVVLLPGPLPASLSAHPSLLTAGAFTSIPLLLFATAARSLRLTTVGFLQYLCPTVQFLLAVALYHEPFTPTHAVTFALIWVALAIYTADSYRAYRAPTPIVAVPEPEPV
jgi:chloramphenicol-sensitive protein RarD